MVPGKKNIAEIKILLDFYMQDGYNTHCDSGRGSACRALPWGGRGRGFESRRSDHFGSPAFTGNPRKGLFFCLW